MKLNFTPKRKKKSAETEEDFKRETNVRFAVSAQNVQKALQHWKWRLLNVRLRDSITRLSALAFMAAGSWCAVNAAETPASGTQPDGYFLSLDQKSQLINEGRITGTNGALYDVRLVPGYKPTVNEARSNLELAGEQFETYASSDLYSDIGTTYRDGTEFVTKDVAQKFIYEGIRDEWTESMGRAAETTRKQVIGWPLAFPWSVTKSTVETAGRAALGTAGIAGGAAYYYALSPTFQLAAPAAAGTVEGAGGGVALPAIKAAWNTVVAPPLALAGRVPSEDRADGYFVKLIQPVETTPVAEIENDPVNQLAEELSQSNSAATDESASHRASAGEGGCCAIFTEILRQQMACAVIDARASIPQ